MIEVAPIRGCVPKMIRDTMNYLKAKCLNPKDESIKPIIPSVCWKLHLCIISFDEA